MSWGAEQGHDRVVSLRALAHPVRLQMLSLLTGAPMSAAEVARELGLTHANASYHLRQLLAAGQLVEAGEETIRGGRAKRYRYDVDAPGATAPDAGERETFFRLLADELLRRSPSIDPASRQTSTDAELWVDPDDWARALDQVNEALSHAAPSGPAAADTGRGARQREPRDVRDGQPGRRRAGAVTARAVLRHRSFVALLTGRSVSLAGNGLANIAITFAVLDLTGSATDLGLVLAARSIPQVVLLLFGGVIADRLPRHLVLVVSNLVCGLTQTLAATLLLTDHATVGALVAIEAVNGASSAFIFPASAGLLPQTVPAGELQPANAIFRMFSTAAMVVGVSIGGILVAGVGPGWGLAVDALSFVVAAACFATIRLAPAVRHAVRQRPHRPARGLVGVPVAHLAVGRRARLQRHQRGARGRAGSRSARSSPTRPSAGRAGDSCSRPRPRACSSPASCCCGCGSAGRCSSGWSACSPGRRSCWCSPPSRPCCCWSSPASWPASRSSCSVSAGTSRCSSTCRRTCSAGSTPTTRSAPWSPSRSARSSPVRWPRRSGCARRWRCARWC